MNIKTTLICLMILPFTVGSILGQEETAPSTLGRAKTIVEKSPFARPTLPQRRGFPSYLTSSLNSAERERDQEIGEAAKALRQADTSADRADAEAKLEELLSSDYDDRLKGYDDYLNELEEKVTKMRSQLQKRRDAKAEMIQLRIQVLESEAEDLGWPQRMKRSAASWRTLSAPRTNSGGK